MLLIPVGGYFTIEATEAIQVINQLPSVRVVLPMHYYVEGYCPWRVIAPIDGFLNLIRAEGWLIRELDAPQVSLSPDTLPESVEIWVLPFLTD